MKGLFNKIGNKAFDFIGTISETAEQILKRLNQENGEADQELRGSAETLKELISEEDFTSLVDRINRIVNLKPNKNLGLRESATQFIRGKSFDVSQNGMQKFIDEYKVQYPTLYPKALRNAKKVYSSKNNEFNVIVASGLKTDYEIEELFNQFSLLITIQQAKDYVTGQFETGGLRSEQNQQRVVEQVQRNLLSKIGLDDIDSIPENVTIAIERSVSSNLPRYASPVVQKIGEKNGVSVLKSSVQGTQLVGKQIKREPKDIMDDVVNAVADNIVIEKSVEILSRLESVKGSIQRQIDDKKAKQTRLIGEYPTVDEYREEVNEAKRVVQEAGRELEQTDQNYNAALEESSIAKQTLNIRYNVLLERLDENHIKSSDEFTPETNLVDFLGLEFPKELSAETRGKIEDEIKKQVEGLLGEIGLSLDQLYETTIPDEQKNITRGILAEVKPLIQENLDILVEGLTNKPDENEVVAQPEEPLTESQSSESLEPQEAPSTEVQTNTITGVEIPDGYTAAELISQGITPVMVELAEKYKVEVDSLEETIKKRKAEAEDNLSDLKRYFQPYLDPNFDPFSRNNIIPRIPEGYTLQQLQDPDSIIDSLEAEIARFDDELVFIEQSKKKLESRCKSFLEDYPFFDLILSGVDVDSENISLPQLLDRLKTEKNKILSEQKVVLIRQIQSEIDRLSEYSLALLKEWQYEQSKEAYDPQILEEITRNRLKTSREIQSLQQKVESYNSGEYDLNNLPRIAKQNIGFIDSAIGDLERDLVSIWQGENNEDSIETLLSSLISEVDDQSLEGVETKPVSTEVMPSIDEAKLIVDFQANLQVEIGTYKSEEGSVYNLFGQQQEAYQAWEVARTALEEKERAYREKFTESQTAKAKYLALLGVSSNDFDVVSTDIVLTSENYETYDSRLDERVQEYESLQEEIDQLQAEIGEIQPFVNSMIQFEETREFSANYSDYQGFYYPNRYFQSYELKDVPSIIEFKIVRNSDGLYQVQYKQQAESALSIHEIPTLDSSKRAWDSDSDIVPIELERVPSKDGQAGYKTSLYVYRDQFGNVQIETIKTYYPKPGEKFTLNRGDSVSIPKIYGSLEARNPDHHIEFFSPHDGRYSSSLTRSEGDESIIYRCNDFTNSDMTLDPRIISPLNLESYKNKFVQATLPPNISLTVEIPQDAVINILDLSGGNTQINPNIPNNPYAEIVSESNTLNNYRKIRIKSQPQACVVQFSLPENISPTPTPTPHPLQYR